MDHRLFPGFVLVLMSFNGIENSIVYFGDHFTYTIKIIMYIISATIMHHHTHQTQRWCPVKTILTSFHERACTCSTQMSLAWMACSPSPHSTRSCWSVSAASQSGSTRQEAVCSPRGEGHRWSGEWGPCGPSQCCAHTCTVGTGTHTGKQG